MNIGLIGSGGREHALCKKIYESNLINKIFCIPGNAGTAKIAINIEANILNFNQILKIVNDNHINLVIVGPEEPLVKGIVDFLKKKKIKVFGPNKFAAKLEGSKSFMKKICFKNNIPTANFKICNNLIHVKKFLKKTKFPVVVKADGLAAGKGVTICKNREEVFNNTIQIFKGKFKSSKKVILEEYLEGEEASYFLIVDKNSFKFFGSAQDHKRVFEKDKGPNTGGMGAYSPAPIINKDLEKKIITRIVKPTLRAIKKEKNFYSGFLYVGLMIKNNEPYLIEYNIRMGDPECQVILPRLKTDLLNLIIKTTENKLKNLKIKWRKEKCMTIVLCAKGYPGKYKKNVRIKNLDKVKLMKNDFIYHAGTKVKNDQIFSSGGRVLNITSTGRSYLKIRKKIISLIKKINWKQGLYRRDIGWKVINKNASN
tara:strand:+ start:4064 stop:5341 length:1278 start_codon:yes stop_codon:yes gene_type:complete